ncbi:MAG: Rrf2 family transcriptional regulator, partial [Planctomycetota bacterium]
MFSVRLSLHTDYALRTLMFLAAEQRRVQIAEIAEFFQISKDHLAKVVQRLAQVGLIRSIRGVGGGLELARPADSIRLLDVIEPIEGSLHLLDCVAIDDVCVIQPGCRLKTILSEAE